MQLRIKSTPASLIVYREKWGTLASTVLVGIVCIAFGLGFYHLMAEAAGSSRTFLAVFCATFVLIGSLFLIRILRYARKLFAEGGLNVLLVNIDGITIAQSDEFTPVRHPWRWVTGVLLTEQLRIVDFDETLCLWRTVVVFLSADTPETNHWLGRARSGIASSGEGKAFVTTSFPKGQGKVIEAAIRRFAPEAVEVRYTRKVVFDTKTSSDSYIEHT